MKRNSINLLFGLLFFCSVNSEGKPWCNILKDDLGGYDFRMELCEILDIARLNNHSFIDVIIMEDDSSKKTIFHFILINDSLIKVNKVYTDSSRCFDSYYTVKSVYGYFVEIDQQHSISIKQYSKCPNLHESEDNNEVYQIAFKHDTVQLRIWNCCGGNSILEFDSDGRMIRQDNSHFIYKEDTIIVNTRNPIKYETVSKTTRKKTVSDSTYIEDLIESYEFGFYSFNRSEWIIDTVVSKTSKFVVLNQENLPVYIEKKESFKSGPKVSTMRIEYN